MVIQSQNSLYSLQIVDELPEDSLVTDIISKFCNSRHSCINLYLSKRSTQLESSAKCNEFFKDAFTT